MDLADEIYEMRDITYDEQITHLVGIVGQYSMQMTSTAVEDILVFWLIIDSFDKRRTNPPLKKEIDKFELKTNLIFMSNVMWGFYI